MSKQSDLWADSEAAAPEVAPLSRDQAQALQAQLGTLCLTCALVGQGVLAGLALLLLFLAGVAWSWWCSALAGALAAWLPQLVLVLGAGRKMGQAPAAAWLLRLFCWEAVKVVLTLALMALAAVWIPGVSWLAMLLAFIFTLKAGWGMLLVQHLRKRPRLAQSQGDLNE